MNEIEKTGLKPNVMAKPTDVEEYIGIYRGPIEGTEDFEHVMGAHLGSGYDWDDLEAFWSPSRKRFYWLSGSGCSCNSLGDGLSSLSDFEDGDRDQLAAAVRRHYEQGYNISAKDLLDDLEAVRVWLPASLRKDKK